MYMVRPSPFGGSPLTLIASPIGPLSGSFQLGGGSSRGRGLPNKRGAAEGSITVVVVDDEPLVRAALAYALSGSGVELVGEATSGEDAVRLVVDLRPDVVVMDVRLPRMSGLEVIRRLSQLAPASRVR